MNKCHKKRSVWGYFRLAILAVMVSIVGALVAVAILNRGGLIILAYTVFVVIILVVVGCKK